MAINNTVEPSFTYTARMSGSSTSPSDTVINQRQSILSGITDFITQSKTWLDNTMDDYGFTKEHLFQKVSESHYGLIRSPKTKFPFP